MPKVQLDKTRNGQTVAVAAGDALEIQLPENPTTGHRWQVDDENACLVLRKSEYQSDAEERVGGGGNRIFEFKATAVATVRLRLRLVRSWDSKEPADRFGITVDIQ